MAVGQEAAFQKTAPRSGNTWHVLAAGDDRNREQSRSRRKCTVAIQARTNRLATAAEREAGQPPFDADYYGFTEPCRNSQASRRPYSPGRQLARSSRSWLTYLPCGEENWPYFGGALFFGPLPCPLVSQDCRTKWPCHPGPALSAPEPLRGGSD